MKPYCTQNQGDCSTCSLVSYGRDCRNNLLAGTGSKAVTQIIPTVGIVDVLAHDPDALEKAETIENAIKDGATVQEIADMFSTEKEKIEADTLIRSLTVFESFQDLLDAPMGYRPSIQCLFADDPQDNKRLADLYDTA